MSSRSVYLIVGSGVIGLSIAKAIKDKHESYMTSLKLWWGEHQAKLEALPAERNVYDLYHAFSATITAKISSLGILDEFKCRGAFAGFWNEIFNVLRSVAARCWRPIHGHHHQPVGHSV